MISLDVLTPYHGDPEYLYRAVDSVRALEDTDWRMTIVEDCYPGGEAVQRRIEAIGDDRIRYLRNEKNLGVAGNKHRTIREATREYFTVLDADDLMLPTYGKQIAALVARRPDAALLQPAVEVIDERDVPHFPLPDRVKSWARPTTGDGILSGETAVASLLRGNWLYTPALTYRRDIAQDLVERPDSDAVHDLAMVVDILLRGGTLVLGAEVAFRYRRHKQSHSSTVARSGERFAQERAYFIDIESELRARSWHKAAAAARHRVFSRLNALSQLPGAASARQTDAVRSLLRHALS
ncbi:glycosyltransferase family 2 protein [Actinokineospora iranica]|uniref:Glycosyltransferase involved in cell wall bisynthesis n=1 Tax=Actinokineospora iranica TaxID=1271860 RepID=A0A1G6Q513_9PSEU|nr:glycosyltransferase family 2 protein [Actinokineospora iranica]SDC86715.1 Glycosyltransferase involved in cell wall bisynthesis [Actinokineospora iranica]